MLLFIYIYIVNVWLSPISHPQRSPQPQDGLAFEFGEEVKGVRPLNAFAEEARTIGWDVLPTGKIP